MAYQAPKWTQLTAPSGTTSVNALTAAGDLFSKAIASAQTGLSNYDKGVESRLKEDSDVNTAALRRRLEGAGNLDDLNAMQGDISATGLEGYGKRIDADALSQSFDKERGVLRGEYQSQYNEDMTGEYLNATTVDQVNALNARVQAENQSRSWMDISQLQNTGATSLKTAKDLQNTYDFNTATAATYEQSAAQLRDQIAQNNLDPKHANYEVTDTMLNTKLSEAKTREQGLYNKTATASMREATVGGVSDLMAARDALLLEAESNPDLDVNGVHTYFNSQRTIALQNDMDQLNNATTKSGTDLLDSNLAAMKAAQAELPEEFRGMVTFDKNGTLNVNKDMPADMANQFTASAATNGYSAAPKTPVEQEAEFRKKDNPATAGFSPDEVDAAWKLKNDLQNRAVSIKEKPAELLATTTININKSVNDQLTELKERHNLTLASNQVDIGTLTAIEKSKGDAFKYAEEGGWLENYEFSWSKDEMSQTSLLSAITVAKSKYSDNDIIDALNSGNIPAGIFEDKQVNSADFLAYLESNVAGGKRSKDLKDHFDARDLYNSQVAELELLRTSSVSAAKKKALFDSGVRDTKANRATIDKVYKETQTEVTTVVDGAGVDAPAAQVATTAADTSARIVELRNRVNKLKTRPWNNQDPTVVSNTANTLEKELNSEVTLNHFGTEESLVDFFNTVTRKNQWGNIRTVGAGFKREIDKLDVSEADKRSIEADFKLRIKIANDQ